MMESMESRFGPMIALAFVAVAIIGGVFATRWLDRPQAQRSDQGSADEQPAAEQAVIAFDPSERVRGEPLTTFQAGGLSRFALERGTLEPVALTTLPLAPAAVAWPVSFDRAIVQLQNPAASPADPWYRADLPVGSFGWWLVSGSTKPAALPSGVTNPVWNADGTKIAYVFVNPLEPTPAPSLAVSEPSGANWRTIVKLGTLFPGRLAWSPDGLWLAFTDSGAAGGTYVVGLSTKQLVKAADSGQSLKWSPEGTRMLIDDGSGARVLVAEPNGSTVTEVTVASTADQLVWESETSLVGFADGNLIRIDLAKRQQTVLKPAPTVSVEASVLGVHDNQLFYHQTGSVFALSLS